MFLSRKLISAPLIALLLACALPASAQTGEPAAEETPPPAPNKAAAAEKDEWKVQLIPFIWVPATDLSVSYGDRTLNTVIEPSDLVGKVQFALAGAIEASNGPWAIRGEGLYMNLANDVDFRRVAGSLRANETMLQATGFYRLTEADDEFAVDLGAGLRFYDFGFTNSFTRDGRFFTQNYESHHGKSWVDPLVGLRARLPLSKDLSFNVYGDVGGFGIGSDLSWRAQAIFDYSVSDSVSLNLGYSVLAAKIGEGSGLDQLNIDFKNYGPVVGATFTL